MKVTIIAMLTTVTTLWNRVTSLNPKTPASMTTPTATTKTTTSTAPPLGHPSRAKTVFTASTVVTTMTISHPTRTRYETRVGTALPRTPNAVREMTIVGADARVPARLTRPTRKNDTTIPSTPARAVGMKLIPKAASKAAIEMLSNEMLEAAHGQKSDRGVPCRSSSGMTLIPLLSTCRAGGASTDRGGEDGVMRPERSHGHVDHQSPPHDGRPPVSWPP